MGAQGVQDFQLDLTKARRRLEGTLELSLSNLRGAQGVQDFQLELTKC